MPNSKSENSASEPSTSPQPSQYGSMGATSPVPIKHVPSLSIFVDISKSPRSASEESEDDIELVAISSASVLKDVPLNLDTQARGAVGLGVPGSTSQSHIPRVEKRPETLKKPLVDDDDEDLSSEDCSWLCFKRPC